MTINFKVGIPKDLRKVTLALDELSPDTLSAIIEDLSLTDSKDFRLPALKDKWDELTRTN